jgi:hypothetical protein
VCTRPTLLPPANSESDFTCFALKRDRLLRFPTRNWLIFQATLDRRLLQILFGQFETVLNYPKCICMYIRTISSKTGMLPPPHTHLRRFEPTIWWSEGSCLNHHSTPPRLLAILIYRTGNKPVKTGLQWLASLKTITLSSTYLPMYIHIYIPRWYVGIFAKDNNDFELRSLLVTKFLGSSELENDPSKV